MELIDSEVWRRRADNPGMTPNEALQVLDWLYKSRISYSISTFWSVKGCGYAATLGLNEEYLPDGSGIEESSELFDDFLSCVEWLRDAALRCHHGSRFTRLQAKAANDSAG
jgi:hypothetical protein